MAKGLGAILAEGHMAQEQARIAAGEAVPCPLCSRAMEFNGAAWFCYKGHDFTDTQRKAAYEASQRGEVVFNGSPGYWDPEMQGVVVAGILNEDQEVVGLFMTVRGGYGRTNWRASPEMDFAREEFPGMVKRHGWTMQEFMMEESNG
jgi:hypothetical protein